MIIFPPSRDFSTHQRILPCFLKQKSSRFQCSVCSRHLSTSLPPSRESPIWRRLWVRSSLPPSSTTGEREKWGYRGSLNWPVKFPSPEWEAPGLRGGGGGNGGGVFHGNPRLPVSYLLSQRSACSRCSIQATPGFTGPIALFKLCYQHRESTWYEDN